MRVGANAKAPVTGAAHKRSTKGQVVLMHLVRAINRGLCFGRRGDRRAEIEAVVRIACNAMFAEDRRAGRPANVSNALKWVQRKGLDISEQDAERIAIDEVRTGFLYSIEDRGEMLRITRDERVRHKLWMLGAHGQTVEERMAETEARQEYRRDKRLAAARKATAAKRGPFHVNVSGVARELGLSRPTVRALRDEWEKAARAGGNRTDFSTFCRDRINNSEYSYKGMSVGSVEICLILDISRSTFYEWRKIPGKIESELKAARPSKAATAFLKAKRRSQDRKRCSGVTFQLTA